MTDKWWDWGCFVVVSYVRQVADTIHKCLMAVTPPGFALIKINCGFAPFNVQLDSQPHGGELRALTVPLALKQSYAKHAFHFVLFFQNPRCHGSWAPGICCQGLP